MAVQTFLRLVNGIQNVIKTVELGVFQNSGTSPTGNMIPNTNQKGILDPSLLNATVLSGGAGDAAKIVQLDANGKIDTTILPTTVGVETQAIVTTEALAAGDWVNVYNLSGDTPRVRKADATAIGKQCTGFVLASFASGATAVVYLEGSNNQVSGRVAGQSQFLSHTTPGKSLSPDAGDTLPTAANSIVQNIGVATSATSVTFSYQPPVLNT